MFQAGSLFGRGNGVGGVSSDLVLTNGAVVTAANFSAGYNGGSSANLPKGSVTMNNSSTLNITGNGAVNFAESTGSAFTMTLNGASQFIGAGTGVKSLPYSGLGTVTLNDSSMIQFGNAVCYVGHNYGTGVVTVASSSAAFYNGGELQIGGSDTSGTGSNANGTFILNAGTVGVGALTIGRGNNNQNGVKGVLYINGGTFTCTNDVLLAYAGANTTSGKIAMNGGTLNVGTTVTSYWLRFGQYDYTSGEIDITNGNLNLNTGTSIKYNQNGSTGPEDVQPVWRKCDVLQRLRHDSRRNGQSRSDVDQHAHRDKYIQPQRRNVVCAPNSSPRQQPAPESSTSTVEHSRRWPATRRS